MTWMPTQINGKLEYKWVEREKKEKRILIDITFNCLTCGKEKTEKNRLNKTYKYCSRECMYKRETRLLNLKCEICSASFKRPPCKHITKHSLCSIECRNIWMRTAMKKNSKSSL